MKAKRSAIVPVIVLYIALTCFFIVGRNMLEKWNADADVLIAGNSLLFLITLISFLVAQRGLRNSNPHAFVRSVYGSIMIKLFLCIIAAFIYIAYYRDQLNKPALFICMGLYLVYTFLEVSILMKMLRQKTNA